MTSRETGPSQRDSIEQLEAALARAEAAAKRLAGQHARLRRETRAAVAEMDLFLGAADAGDTEKADG